jgi:hypothetical protein
MLAGHEQDDDVTLLVMHVPADAAGAAGGYGSLDQHWDQR